ncbi:Scr1 family TA system antitoxin-like transcriptional regulator [Streptomyces sp. NPDC102365]|uniref:Scr1 family TA system antitoxin-like transcriptional regulator n=1 Tax=Streptomyces sp. NPDC102365 TaxID=3366162 RepID=UPI003806FFD1
MPGARTVSVCGKDKHPLRVHGLAGAAHLYASPVRQGRDEQRSAAEPVGGPDVMRARLEHLLQVAQLPNVRLQVLPFRTGGHPCITGPFNIDVRASDPHSSPWTP